MPFPSENIARFSRPGFHWRSADAYLFDIDGTLLNSRDPVHYLAFHHAMREIFGIETKIDGVPVQGNTDIGILRAALRREGFADSEIDRRVPQLAGAMCAEAQRTEEQMQPELCPSIRELITSVHTEDKLLGVASGNLEAIGWAKLKKAGLREMFSFGAFSFPLEFRKDIFQHGLELARERLGRQATVYVVGDTPADITSAQAVGAGVIAIATGIFKFEELLALSPDACFATATDMLASK